MKNISEDLERIERFLTKKVIESNFGWPEGILVLSNGIVLRMTEGDMGPRLLMYDHIRKIDIDVVGDVSGVDVDLFQKWYTEWYRDYITEQVEKQEPIFLPGEPGYFTWKSMKTGKTMYASQQLDEIAGIRAQEIIDFFTAKDGSDYWL